MSVLLTSRKHESQLAAEMDERPGPWDGAFIEGESAFSTTNHHHSSLPPPHLTASHPTNPTIPSPYTTDINTQSAPRTPHNQLDPRSKHNKARKLARQARIAEGADPEKAFGRDRKKARLLKKAHTLTVNLQGPHLPHSSQGYLGPTTSPADSVPSPSIDPLPTSTNSTPEPVDPRDARLQELKDLGYRYIPSTDVPELIVDNEGTIIAWKVGPLGHRSTWDITVRGIMRALADLDFAIFGGNAPSTAKQPKAGAARGKFRCAHYGYSYGGGQEVSSLV